MKYFFLRGIDWFLLTLRVQMYLVNCNSTYFGNNQFLLPVKYPLLQSVTFSSHPIHIYLLVEITALS